MTELLQNEEHIINLYNEQRDKSSMELLAKESESNEQLELAFNQYDKTRSELIDELKQNEQLQMSAVAALIVNNDARSWGLIEQVRIIEAELVKMTLIELEKKKISSDSTVDDLCIVRMNLTAVLVDLLDQQEKRRLQLFETLRYIEEQNEENKNDFWLMQYQKLIDSHPTGITAHVNGIDPLLGYNFLVNGVVHCLPFLSKFWQKSNNVQLELLSENDLIEAGIKNETDRKNIIKSIEEYLHQEAKLAPITQTTSLPSGSLSIPAPTQSSINQIDSNDNITVIQNECVVCMERESDMVFLPCGHLCCCNNCQMPLIECPICRGKLERRVKVIKS